MYIQEGRYILQILHMLYVAQRNSFYNYYLLLIFRIETIKQKRKLLKKNIQKILPTFELNHQHIYLGAIIIAFHMNPFTHQLQDTQENPFHNHQHNLNTSLGPDIRIWNNIYIAFPSPPTPIPLRFVQAKHKYVFPQTHSLMCPQTRTHTHTCQQGLCPPNFFVPRKEKVKNFCLQMARRTENRNSKNDKLNKNRDPETTDE